MSRLAAGRAKPLVCSMEQPFSSFDFAEEEFEPEFSIRRLFSIARALQARLVVVEEVPAEGAVADENEEIRRIYPDYRCESVKRVTFWRASAARFRLSSRIPRLLTSGRCLGCVILKKDTVPSASIARWHVFEAVMECVKSRFHYHPAIHGYDFAVGKSARRFSIQGFLYCQQNHLNKLCAQVALRSLCAPYLGNMDLPFSAINAAAAESAADFHCGKPWQTDWIKAALDKLGLGYFALDYVSDGEGLRALHPYQYSVYAGVECGYGALLAFTFNAGADEEDADKGDELRGHVIPCFGHTFNEDAWVPNADAVYFKVSNLVRYIPSSSFMSSVIVHDDNFGPNLGTPQHFIPPQRVGLVIALKPPGFQMYGKHAEVLGAAIFEDLIGKDLLNHPARWMERLLEHRADRKRIVLRAVPVTWWGYVEHLSTLADWSGAREEPGLLEILREADNGRHLWLIEVSVPDVFAANRRRIGEVLVDGSKDSPLPDSMFSVFVMARFPGRYIFMDAPDEDSGHPFYSMPSALHSHVPLFPASRGPSVKAAPV